MLTVHADADLYFSIATPISAHKCLKCGPADTKISQVRLLNNCQAEGSRYSFSRLTYCYPFNLIDTRARDVLPSVQIPPHTITEPPPCFLGLLYAPRLVGFSLHSMNISPAITTVKLKPGFVCEENIAPFLMCPVLMLLCKIEKFSSCFSKKELVFSSGLEFAVFICSFNQSQSKVCVCVFLCTSSIHTSYLC